MNVCQHGIMNAAVNNLEFYLTGEVACPYLPGKRQRLVWTPLPEDAESVYSTLTDFGFRRSSEVLYSNLCANCTACIPVRIRVRDFVPTRRQKRIQRKNRILQRSMAMPMADREDYGLFQSYLDARHPDGLMQSMTFDDYAAMLEAAPALCRMIRYAELHDGETVRSRALALTDLLPDGLSMCYSFFDLAMQRHSPGIFIILDHVALARSMNLDYVYLGYWIRDCPKMSYKSEFGALEYNRYGEWYAARDEWQTAMQGHRSLEV